MIADARIQFLNERIARFNDQTAYNELFTAFYPNLLTFAMGFIKSRQPAEEIVSDVFINIWQKRSRLEHVSNLKLYLYTATRNTALNYLSRHNRVMITELSEIPVELSTLPLNPERMMITAEMKKMIQEAVDRLPARCRLVFKLVREDELKYREVAELLKISQKTVEAQMTIALKRIGEVVKFDIHKTQIASPKK
ncbi:RNA polymerase sigma-70 factor [Flavihumibacter petaseus]|uniref:Putative RNA polymerase ECF-type sigma factor n=1 Tax=Flavihumibacter petaseus NBRC 106054 TaxID=1220578 RepID=A0A0E9MZF3_9BACT|nr:RNA polymerase sigma-70 factor [Flavihumibacter petaseus]GAO42771.1 putative RNA polymerase ECF-type sigma factor [Flavihumibacter petaseus NBRC 106054]